MSEFIAALPMYDWPESRAETDAEWARLRDAFRVAGVDAPERLVRRNADLPAMPGGIRSLDGAILTPDPASLPPDELDFRTVWLHPQLLFAQTCWGPMEQGLSRHVQVIGQPSYDGFEGGQGELYSSAILMRRGEGHKHASAPAEGCANIPLDLLRSRRLAFNSPDSMSGIIALSRDLEAMGATTNLFSERVETGGHRDSIVAVTEGRADVCAIDCRTWAMALRFERAAKDVRVVGWTKKRKGLPYITAAHVSGDLLARLRAALASVAQPAMSLASSG
ncbi:phosphate/phosphite/phosphonate ABC transporter substrate-binding protein [Allomesorhizobium camelthorni]|uniref:PhnD/SsuA/transferrin family substrate-binding protein n=1 Tax=Allomesorhizobium camelthorni TaxID=475069 RepID=A0A6G4W771_9HYPH|nr:PhnD/SsuA/transferrin family substrate-binding protein [Mesorhizobium camelthorni]NGO50168.1 PhnD/SsuA/transferrin family substrate-binding protein [Mesorhizobium camelthorni]